MEKKVEKCRRTELTKILQCTVADGRSCIVRPTKKPTNLSQSGEVPKGGRWMNFWKEVFRWKGGGEGCLGFYRFTFFSFSCFGLVSCTLQGCDFVPAKFQKYKFKKGSEKHTSSPR